MKIRFPRLKFHIRPPVQAETKEKSPLFYLFCFFIVVLVVMILAGLWRFIFLVQRSTFSTSSYTVLVQSQHPFVIAIDKTTPKLFLVSVPAGAGESRLKTSLLLGIPIDGEIKTSSQNISKDTFPNTPLLMSLILQPWQYSHKDMTVFDMMNLTNAANGMSQKKSDQYAIKLSKDHEVLGMTQEEVYDVFKDPTIINEQISVEVVNATSIEGLAGNAGRVLKNAGVNIVSVTSGADEQVSQIIASSPSVTLTRISHLLGIQPTIREDFHSIADIKIILGDDFGRETR